MLIHQLKRRSKIKNKKRIGRGGKRGTYSGRGQKGQKSRAGRRIKPQIKEQLLKIPKRRGFKFSIFKEKPKVINLSLIDKKFQAGEKVSPETLLAKGLISRVKGRLPAVKILGSGKLTKKVSFEKVGFSASARKAAEK